MAAVDDLPFAIDLGSWRVARTATLLFRIEFRAAGDHARRDAHRRLPGEGRDPDSSGAARGLHLGPGLRRGNGCGRSSSAIITVCASALAQRLLVQRQKFGPGLFGGRLVVDLAALDRPT